ncbi:hypothetical protein Tco_0296164 [Tanacetum coccineum]
MGPPCQTDILWLIAVDGWMERNADIKDGASVKYLGMLHSHSNDDTCFRVDVIDEVTKEELDALLDDSKPFSTMSEKISESSLNHEFKEFMAINIKEIP